MVCYIAMNYFYGIFLTFHLYFTYTPIMFPKNSARDGGKEKRKTMKANLGVKKEIIAEHEN